MLALLQSLSKAEKVQYGKNGPISLVGIEPAIPFSFPLFSTLDLHYKKALIHSGGSSAPIQTTSMEKGHYFASCGQAGIALLLIVSWTRRARRNTLVESLLRRTMLRLLGPTSFGCLSGPKARRYSLVGI